MELDSNIKCFILIEPGYGYIIPVLREKFKTAKIIALHIGDFPKHDEAVSYKNTSAEELEIFLDSNLTDISACSIRIIEWRPSLNFYKESYLKILSQTVKYIKQMDAAPRTTAAFGKRWVKNFFKNILNINKCLLYKETSIPAIITGSGPGLEQALPIIKKAQAMCIIIAASSSLSALFHNDIRPDFIIAADGGSWALRHLHACFRNNSALYESIFLAVNLSAALPSQCGIIPKLIINDGSLWQSISLHALGIPSVVIPQRGTVTAGAVDLALILSSADIFTAGMDFSVCDIRTHVKPYNFDNLFFEKADRLNPCYAQSFTRSFLIRGGGSMDIYASWFKNQLSNWPKRIYSIGNKNNIFKDGCALLENYFNEKNENKNIQKNYKIAGIKEDTKTSGETAVKAVLSALKDKNYSTKLKQELSSLLFAGGKEADAACAEGQIESTLCEIAHNVCRMKAVNE